jgi:hypothetical protein
MMRYLKVHTTKLAASLLMAVVITLAFSFSAWASETLPLPQYDYGACPFECCTYRTWTAKMATSLYDDFIKTGKPSSVVNKGEVVEGVSGVVITTKAGTVRVLKEMVFEQEASEEKILLHPEDILLYLRHVGECYDRFWYKGQFLLGETCITEVGATEVVDVQSMPEWVWWAEIQRSNGEVGWTPEVDHFAGVDACD